MARCKWLVLLLLIPAMCGFDTRNPFRTRGPFKAYDFTIGSVGGGGGCTDGVDCLCDTLTTSSTLLFCEDWEASGYYDDTTNSWAAGELLGAYWNRGANSEWENRYGNGDHALFQYNDGVPTIGQRCQYGSGSPGGTQGCTGMKEYCSEAQGSITTAGGADCWGPGVNSGASIDIQREGDVDDVVAGLALTGGTGTAAEIGGGNTTFAHYIRPGSTAGKVGSAYMKSGGGGTSSNYTSVTEIGVTMKIAYSPNIFTETDSVTSAQWKHDEWFGSRGDAYAEQWFVGNTGCGTSDKFPYRPYFLTINAGQAACNASLAQATVNVGGTPYCDDVAMRLCAGSNYSRSSDWPGGAYKCVRAHLVGMGTTSMDLTVYHGSTTVIDIDNLDGTAMDNQAYRAWLWNAYSNRNEDDNVANDTDQAMYRYEDDIIVVNGPPEPCSKIGM